MAEIGLIEKFQASHGTKLHKHDFRVEIILEGKIDQQTGFVKGMDHYEVIAELKKIISKIQNKNLKEILTGAGYNSSGNESIATYFLKLLKENFPVKCVKIWETDNRYAIVYSKEV